MIKKAVLLTGSPKQSDSVSERLGTLLTDSAEFNVLEKESINIARSVRTEEGVRNMLRAVDSGDLIILICPLYVDGVPSFVMKAMEEIYRNAGKATYSGKSMMVIVHCGFPESRQNSVAIDIYKRFASDAGFKWLGGLSLGMSPVVKMDKMGWMTRSLRKSFGMVAASVSEGGSIPQEAAYILSEPFMPIGIYKFAGNIMWISLAVKNGTWNICNRV